MNQEALLFCASNISKKEVAGKRIFEVGSRKSENKKYSGTIRPYIESLDPEEYVGIDKVDGKNVDKLCSAENIVDVFGKNSFDFLIATEVLEHIRNWKKAISNFKRVLKPKGSLIVTTRSRGFSYHPFPEDFWRFGKRDMKNIFEDMEILSLEDDKQYPGVFLKAKKPEEFEEMNLNDQSAYCVITGMREKSIGGFSLNSPRHKILKLKFIISDYLLRKFL